MVLAWLRAHLYNSIKKESLIYSCMSVNCCIYCNLSAPNFKFYIMISMVSHYQPVQLHFVNPGPPQLQRTLSLLLSKKYCHSVRLTLPSVKSMDREDWFLEHFLRITLFLQAKAYTFHTCSQQLLWVLLTPWSTTKIGNVVFLSSETSFSLTLDRFTTFPAWILHPWPPDNF